MTLPVLALALASACGSEETDTRGCVAGQSVGCVGPNGCSGYQVCNDDGTSFGACACASDVTETGGGSMLASGGSSGGASVSTGGLGGGDAAGGRTDATGGRAATGGTEATGGATVECTPKDMSEWGPPAYVPARAPSAVCTETLIREYSTDCLNGNDCAPFEEGGQYADCGDCLRPSPMDQDEYGPLLLSGIVRETNFAGCIELVGELACAGHQQNKSRCEHEACSENCPVTNTASLELYQQCKTEARSGVCSAYREAAVCIADLAHVEACSGDDFEESLVSVGMVFCGGLDQQVSD